MIAYTLQSNIQYWLCTSFIGSIQTLFADTHVCYACSSALQCATLHKINQNTCIEQSSQTSSSTWTKAHIVPNPHPNHGGCALPPAGERGMAGDRAAAGDRVLVAGDRCACACACPLGDLVACRAGERCCPGEPVVCAVCGTGIEGTGGIGPSDPDACLCPERLRCGLFGRTSGAGAASMNTGTACCAPDPPGMFIFGSCIG